MVNNSIDLADRTNFVPSHVGDHILPADPLFTRLLTNAHNPDQRIVIRDVNTGDEKTAAELLSDVVNFRKVLRSALSQETLRQLDTPNSDKTVYISILAPGGYEFAVGILAILALGAAASPFSPLMPVDEATYYVNKAQSAAVVVATSALPLGIALATKIQQTTNPLFVSIPIHQHIRFSPIPPSSIILSSNLYTSLNDPGFIIFTSGTTGPPKGAVLRRAAITDGALSFAHQLGLTPHDTSLHLLPVHHATGLWVGFFPLIQVGACIEFRSGSFSPEWTWERFAKGGITLFSGVPTIYMRLMRHYQTTLSHLPKNPLAKYTSGINSVRLMICGTSALPRPIDAFFTSLRQGKRIVQRYGSTETGVVFNMPFSPAQNKGIPDGSVGTVTMGVDVKLLPDPSITSSSSTSSSGDEDIDKEEGEVLLKSHQMFSHYIRDPLATKSSHDADGYYRTGDIARRSGPYYFITGRASVDIIKSGGYKISALDIERELLSLPYISEAVVLGVPDLEFGQRVAAIVTLRSDEAAQNFYRENGRSADKLDIDDLRRDARGRLAGYKLPTLLRVYRSGEIPKSGTGKVVKKTLGPQMFSADYREDTDVQVWKSSKGKDGEPKL